MAPPLYFFPTLPLETLLSGLQQGRPRWNRKVLEDYGVAETLGTVDSQQVSTFELATDGPGGKTGAILTPVIAGTPSKRADYQPKFQTWQCVRADPELWIGLDNEERPGPKDLAKRDMVPGHKVRLADGNEYEVPVIRAPSRGTLLPQDMSYDENGEFQMGIKAPYGELWEKSAEAWDLIIGGKDTMPFSEILDLCLGFLGVNYRYGRYEHAVLKLVDTSLSTWHELFCAAVDIPFVLEELEAQKKRDNTQAPETVSSVPGSSGTSPSTAPAEANSSLQRDCEVSDG
jgi:hypothetical protein